MRGALIAAIAVALGVGAYVLHISHREPHAETEAPAHKPNVLIFAADAPQRAYITVAAIDESVIPAIEPLHGRITYDDDVTARISTPIAGRVMAIRAQIGDNVKAGQALAELDAPDFAQAQADARKAHADAHSKKSALERAQLLIDGGVIAQKDYEAALDDNEQAQAEMIRADARLRNLGVSNGGAFTLRTHIGGIVTERRINPGTEIQPDTVTPLFVVTDPSRWWIDLEIPEMDLDKVQIGQRVRVQTDSTDKREYEAGIVSIGKILDPTTRRIPVRCALKDPEQTLKPEMFVRATPLGGDRLRPRVPNNALITEGLKTFLFVEKQNGEFEKREVMLAYRGRDESYIENGVAVGERAVMAGALLLNAEMQGD